MKPVSAAILALSAFSTTTLAATLSPTPKNNQLCSTGNYKDVLPCLKDFVPALEFCSQRYPQRKPTTVTTTITVAPTVLPTTLVSSVTTTVTTTIPAGSDGDVNLPQPGPDVERGQSGGGNKRTLPGVNDKVAKLSNILKQGEQAVKQFCACIRPAPATPPTRTITVRPTLCTTLISTTVVATAQATQVQP